MKTISLAEIQWEYEDQLPEMTDEQYKEIFECSRVFDGVRMFAYVENGYGDRLFLTL